MELKGPSVAELKKFMRFETSVDFYTITNQHFRGKIMWADEAAFQIKLDNEKVVTLVRTAVAYYSAA
jgi:hypothetical protein